MSPDVLKEFIKKPGVSLQAVVFSCRPQDPPEESGDSTAFLSLEEQCCAPALAFVKCVVKVLSLDANVAGQVRPPGAIQAV